MSVPIESYKERLRLESEADIAAMLEHPESSWLGAHSSLGLWADFDEEAGEWKG